VALVSVWHLLMSAAVVAAMVTALAVADIRARRREHERLVEHNRYMREVRRHR
jgi:hypothetical protein